VKNATIILLLSLFAAVTSAQTADILARRVSFNIAPQALSSALIAFSTQSGVEVATAGADISHLKSNGVGGARAVGEALTVLLEGTGLQFDAVGVNTIAITTATRPATQTENPDAAVLEEVLVTAQKRTERLIDTPQSVSVLSADAIARLGATQFRDFANAVPGLTFTTAGAGYTQISLRGVTTGNLDVSSTVGLYIDEVPYGSSTAAAQGPRNTLDMGLFDVERIEVMRGPQGTLYGASTMGGLIKYVSKMPDMSGFGVDARAGISGTRSGGLGYNGAMALNAPLVSDRAALRASAFYSRDGGYIDNLALADKDVNGSDVYGTRADLLLAPTDAITFRIGTFLQNISRDGESTANFALDGTPASDVLDQNRLLRETYDQKFRLVSGTLTYDLGSSVLTSISSYQRTQVDMLWDYSALFVPLLGDTYSVVGIPQGLETKKLTQEVRLASSDAAQRIEWLIGGFYTHERSEGSQAFLLRDAAGAPAVNDLFNFASPSTYEEYAGFGNLTFHLTTKFDVSGGIRHARNRQKTEQIASGPFVSSLPVTRASDSVSTYLANARYHFTDRATGYVRYATGYRPGGPNYIVLDPDTGAPAAPASFDEDRLASYEVGLKAESAARTLGVDFALFYIDWNNVQVNDSVDGFSFRTNVPDGATIRGAELALTARPARALTMTGAFAYQQAELAGAIPQLGGAEGDRLPNVPRFSAVLSADYALPAGTLQPTLGFTLRHLGDRRAAFGADAYRLPEYTSMDLRSGFVFGGVDAQLYVHNLFDERGQLSSDTDRGFAAVSILQPRTIGISATTRF
jgi:iron complex outermembrane recepter protein